MSQEPARTDLQEGEFVSRTFDKPGYATMGTIGETPISIGYHRNTNNTNCTIPGCFIRTGYALIYLIRKKDPGAKRQAVVWPLCTAHWAQIEEKAGGRIPETDGRCSPLPAVPQTSALL